MSDKSKITVSTDMTLFETASIVFSILINTGIWKGHPDVWCFNWIDHAFHNWFWTVFNTIFSVPICCTFILLGAIVAVIIVVMILKYSIKALLRV